MQFAHFPTVNVSPSIPKSLAVPLSRVNSSPMSAPGADQFVAPRFAGTPRADVLAKNALDALKEEQPELAMQFIADGANINFQEHGTTLLSEAIRLGNDALFNLLIERGVEVEPDVSSRYDVPLFLAIREERFDYAKVLLAKGADVNQTEFSTDVPLGLLLPESLIDDALAQGFDMNKQYNGRSVLMCAVQVQNLGWVKRCLDAGQDVKAVQLDGARLTGSNGYAMSGYRPIQFAAEGGDPAVIQLLLERGADPMVTSGDFEYGHCPSSPLRIAAQNGHAAAVKVLLDNLATREIDPAALKELQEKALDNALGKSRTEVVDVFFERGIGVTPQGKPKPELIFPGLTSETMLAHLIKLGIDVNAGRNASYDNKTALIQAAAYGRQSIVDMLLAAGAQVNARDARGYTALMHAKDMSGMSARKRKYGMESKVKLAETLKAKGAKLTIADRAKLEAKFWNPLRMLGRGLDNLFGDIHL